MHSGRCARWQGAPGAGKASIPLAKAIFPYVADMNGCDEARDLQCGSIDKPDQPEGGSF
jgi:hypothetical protein